MSSDESPLLVALDVDRTLFDTSRFVELLYDRLLDHGVEKSTIDAMRDEELSSRGSSFDVVSSLATQKVLPSVEELHSYATELLYEGVSELIGSLVHAKIPFVLLTYGSVVAQSYKISLIEHALGRSLPFHITSEPNKAAWLERIESSGSFAIALDTTDHTVEAPSVILVDDKPGNLQTSHPRIHPILVDNTSSSNHAEKGIAIKNVWGAIQSYI